MFRSIWIAILLILGVCGSSNGYLDPKELQARLQQLRPVKKDPSLSDSSFQPQGNPRDQFKGRAKESFELAKRFAPLVYFHPDEKYFPCSVEWFLKNAQLVKAIEPEKEYGMGPVKPIVKSAKVRQLIEKGQVKEQDLITWKDSKDDQPDKQEVILDLMGDRKTYEGMPINKGDQTSPAPVYCKVIYQGPDQVALQYWFCYAYNGPFAPLSIGGRGPLGIHEGDWESIMVFIQKDNNQKVDNLWKVVSVYLSRHGRDRGEHLKADEPSTLQFLGTHPIIYSAKFGHGSYPSPQGPLPTSDGDLVAKGKVSWRTWNNVELINEKTPWIQFRGRWGLRGMGPKGPIDKPLWKSFSTDEQGNLKKKEADTLLKEVTGIRFDSKKPVLFNIDISTHYFEHCWSLYKKEQNGWVLDKDVDFDVREKKFLGDKSWYHIQAGSGCVKPGTNALKGFYIRALPSSRLTANNRSADYKLVIHAKEPWPIQMDFKEP